MLLCAVYFRSVPFLEFFIKLLCFIKRWKPCRWFSPFAIPLPTTENASSQVFPLALSSRAGAALPEPAVEG